MKRPVLCLVAILGFSLAAAESRSPLSLQVSPSAQIPFGPVQDDGSAFYKLGFGAQLDGDLALPGLKLLAARASLGYIALPINVANKQLTIASLGIGPVLELSPIKRLSLDLAAGGGYALLVGPSKTYGNPFAEASIKAAYSLGSSFNLGLGAAYRLHFNSSGFDYHGLGLSLGASFALGRGPSKPLMRILELQMDPIFPVFFKYYDTNPAGLVRIQNGESGAIDNLKISFSVPQFMSSPKQCLSRAELKAGETLDVPIYALFSDSIIGLTEDTKVEAKVSYSYTYGDTEFKGGSDISLRVYNRNAMTWDDDRRAAAFVSAKDPQVLVFAKTAAGVGRDASGAVNNPFRQAMSIFQALGTYGLRYVPDPTSPFTDQGKAKEAVDYLQFPAQTLAYKAGDCDDLTICYAAMLEATGIEAAFITIPGHIYLAFNLGMELAEAKASLSQTQDLVFRDGRAWLPVEVTMVRDGFLAAWRSGAREWREAEAQGKAAMYPLRDAWRTYEAAAFVGAQAALAPPSAEAETKAFSEEMARFVDAEVKAREPAILLEIKTAQGKDPRPLNKLGVLYAHYGLYDRALGQFTKAAMLDFGPAMVNLGNVTLLNAEAKKARTWFEKALAKDATSVPALVGLSRACLAAEDGAAAKAAYDRLKSIDPKTADKYSGLFAGGASASRAAQAGGAAVFWADTD